MKNKCRSTKLRPQEDRAIERDAKKSRPNAKPAFERDEEHAIVCLQEIVRSSCSDLSEKCRGTSDNDNQAPTSAQNNIDVSSEMHLTNGEMEGAILPLIIDQKMK